MKMHRGGTATISVINRDKTVRNTVVVDCNTLVESKQELRRRYPGTDINVRQNQEQRDFWA